MSDTKTLKVADPPAATDLLTTVIDTEPLNQPWEEEEITDGQPDDRELEDMGFFKVGVLLEARIGTNDKIHDDGAVRAKARGVVVALNGSATPNCAVEDRAKLVLLALPWDNRGLPYSAEARLDLVQDWSTVSFDPDFGVRDVTQHNVHRVYGKLAADMNNYLFLTT